jgi:flagellar hook-associated protein 3 FlgL
VRVTQHTLAASSLQGLNRNLSRMQQLQQQLTSGRTISRPSDSPTGTNEAMRTRGEQAANDQYARNISDGQSWLNTTDSTLGSMLSQVQRVRDLTVQGLNTGSLSDTAKQAIATEVGQIRSSLLGMANTRLQGRPLFGGPTSSATAYDATTGTWQGRGGANGVDVTPNLRRTSDAATVRVDVTGGEAFGDQSQGDDLFAVVDKIAQAVTADPAALSTQLGALDSAITRLTNARTSVGARASQLDEAAQLQQDRALALTSRLSAVEDIDMPKVIMDLQQQQVGYQAALSATAKALPQSLVDYLR